MIEVEPYTLKEVVPAAEVAAWKDRLRKSEPKTACPTEVDQFISAIAAKLGDFGQMRKYNAAITGRELLLCGMKEHGGEKIEPWAIYQLPVPHMIAVDNYSSMLRIFRKKGKAGLIDYCKARVKHTELERVLEILNVEVFHEHRPEFMETMTRIEQSRKLELQLEQ